MKSAALAMQKEMADVNMVFDGETDTISGSTQFFDVFFDNIFTDWSVKESIEENEWKMRRYLEQLEKAENQLKLQSAEIDRKLEEMYF